MVSPIAIVNGRAGLFDKILSAALPIISHALSHKKSLPEAFVIDWNSSPYGTWLQLAVIVLRKKRFSREEEDSRVVPRCRNIYQSINCQDKLFDRYLFYPSRRWNISEYTSRKSCRIRGRLFCRVADLVGFSLSCLRSASHASLRTQNAA